MTQVRNILAFAFLAISTAALADPPANTIMKVAPPHEAADARRLCIMRNEIETAQVGHLGAALTLDAAQKPLFETWKRIHLDVLRALPCPPPPTSLDVPAPQRMQNQILLLTTNLDALHKELQSTTALYEALTPAQRAVFDGPKQGAPPPQAAPAAKPDAPAH
ncbi:MAG TPA: hypothetical protein VHZ29_01645 [Rhizomicrobium sp.]|nr:hypothetical protein [Rhizomicrobium sp.]